MVDVGAYRETILRMKIQETAKKNLLSYAPLDILEHIGEPLGVRKLLANSAVTVLKFKLDEALDFDFTIPSGTEVETKDGLFIFQTTQTVILKSGQLEVSVEASCSTPGSAANNYIIGSINAFIEFTDTRILTNSPNLRLQNNVDRVTKPSDIGLYVFEDGLVKEVNYFTAVEEKTNSLPTQTIIDAPKDENGKSDFLRKVEFSENIMPILTDFEDDDCLVSSSSQYDAINYMAWKAFRHH